MRSSPSQKEKNSTLQPGNPPLEESLIIFYDGDCGLCQRFVQFIYSHDRRKQFQFAPLQGKTAEAYLAPPIRERLNSMILSDMSGQYSESTAAIKIVRQLGGVYSISGLLLLIPSIIRDPVYRWVARNRHRLVLGSETCIYPNQEDSHRFLP